MKYELITTRLRYLALELEDANLKDEVKLVKELMQVVEEHKREHDIESQWWYRFFNVCDRDFKPDLTPKFPPYFYELNEGLKDD